MKRLILVLLSLLAVTTTYAQQKVTLADCGGDTVLYLRKAFDERKAEFIGQPFTKVLDEWKTQLPIEQLLFGNTGIWLVNKEERELVNGADLYYNTERETNVMRKPYYGVGITFAPPFPYHIREFWQLQEEEDAQLGPGLYEKLKNYIVKNIYVFEMKNP